MRSHSPGYQKPTEFAPARGVFSALPTGDAGAGFWRRIRVIWSNNARRASGEKELTVDLEVDFPDGSSVLLQPDAAVEVARGLWHRFEQPGAITAAALIEQALRGQRGGGRITLDAPQADAVWSFLDSAQHLGAAIRRR